MLTNASSKFNDLGLLILRVGVGASFVVFHGYKKIMGGPDKWERLGREMTNLGVDFAPVFWGFMAAFAEFAGAAFLILGLFTRPSALLLAFTMLVATLKHINAHEGYSYSLELGVVFLALLITGAGKYSLDARIKLK